MELSGFLEKISSYNIFNNLLPGVTYIFLTAPRVGSLIPKDDILLEFFTLYFVGAAISRIGSLAIEPLFKWLKFVRFLEYSRYVVACRADAKIDTLSETNNMYRSVLTSVALAVATRTLANYESSVAWSRERVITVLLLVLALIFAFAYRKQTNYITKRVDAVGTGTSSTHD